MYILDRLAKSKFSAKFKLSTKELEYIKDNFTKIIREN